MLQNAGAQVLGVDPAENLVTLCQKKELPVERAYWNRETAAALGETFDFVVAINVLPHVPDPHEFLQACRHALSQLACWVFRPLSVTCL
jgi:2-polyprenyl-3-methyl-5-hydroxy-6-metoxy-1,4-benzoquinol methylase